MFIRNPLLGPVLSVRCENKWFSRCYPDSTAYGVHNLCLRDVLSGAEKAGSRASGFHTKSKERGATQKRTGAEHWTEELI
jgi:hypothetical protein